MYDGDLLVPSGSALGLLGVVPWLPKGRPTSSAGSYGPPAGIPTDGPTTATASASTDVTDAVLAGIYVGQWSLNLSVLLLLTWAAATIVVLGLAVNLRLRR